jgi:hypothetical protein
MDENLQWRKNSMLKELKDSHSSRCLSEQANV